MTTQYRVPELSTFNWQQNVLNQLDTPPGGPAKGDRYIVAGSPLFGAFIGHVNDIAWCSNAVGPVWTFDVPTEGWQVWDETQNGYFVFDGASWAALTAGHTQNTDTGTTSATFDIDTGGTGVRLKDVSGVLEVKNLADNAYETIKVLDAYVTGNVTDGTNATSPLHIKNAYDERAIYDAGLKVITFNL